MASPLDARVGSRASVITVRLRIVRSGRCVAVTMPLRPGIANADRRCPPQRTSLTYYGFLAYRARSPEIAEDLTRETFERALRAWSRFDSQRSDARVWLLSIARNVYIDSRRRSKARPAPAMPVPAVEASAGSEERPGWRGLDPDVARALGRLSRRERDAIALCFGAELSIPDVAEVTGTSVADAQQILSRSLRRLRALL